jgi:hypothetical protein
MRNIHLIATVKPSRLVQKRITKEIKISSLNNPQIWNNVNIYITDTEKPKVGDWVYRDSGVVFKMTEELLDYYESIKSKDIHKRYKITLTDNKDLINDGVQEIPEDFLQWFIQNPSCEEVETKRELIEKPAKSCAYYYHYKIVIPQEEPKQEKERGITITHVGKQETLEEVALRLYPKVIIDPYNPSEDLLEEERNIFINGANAARDYWYQKFQQEREKKFYSEEDIINALHSVELKDNKVV